MTTPEKSGTEFIVNSTVSGSQREPDITTLAGGGFVVTWTDRGQTGGDTSGYAVRAQVFSAGGARVGGEILVNSTITNNQEAPAITALSSGRFVVIWQDLSKTGADTARHAIRAQIFEADGTKRGAEFLVNSTTSGQQHTPDVAALSNGSFVVTWQDESKTGGDTNGSAIRAQIFDSNGAKSGAEFLVTTEVYYDQERPAITALAGGGFAVTWQDFSETGGDTDGYAVRAQSFSATGAKLGGEVLVNTTTTLWQFAPAITALNGGGYVVTWQDRSESADDPFYWAIRAQVFSASGAKVGAEVLVNSTVVGEQEYPTVTALPNGGFVVTWQDFSQTGDDTSGTAIRAQSFSATGEKLGTEFLVNTTTDRGQYAPVITALPDGKFVVAWEDYSRTGYEIRAQIFDAAGGTAPPPPPTPSFIDENPVLGHDDLNVVSFATGALVLWREPGSQTNASVNARYLAVDGSPTGAEIVLGNGSDVQVQDMGDGRHMLSWFNGGTVFGRVLGADGAMSATMTLASISTSVSPLAAISYNGLADGSFWLSYSQGAAGGFDAAWVVRKLAANGTVLMSTNWGNDMPWATSVPDGVFQAKLEFFQNGQIAEFWADDDLGRLVLRTYTATGSPVASFELLPEGAQRPLAPFIEALDNGRFLVLWQNEVDDAMYASVVGSNGPTAAGAQHLGRGPGGLDAQQDLRVVELGNGQIAVLWHDRDAAQIGGAIVQHDGEVTQRLVAFSSVSPIAGDAGGFGAVLTGDQILIHWQTASGQVMGRLVGDSENTILAENAPDQMRIVALENGQVQIVGVEAGPDGGSVVSGKSVTLVAPSNTPPEADTDWPDASSLRGEVVDINLGNFFTDADGDSLSFSADGLPDGLSISAAGRITGTVTSGIGSYAVTVTANDGRGGAASKTFDWDVRLTGTVYKSVTPVLNEKGILYLTAQLSSAAYHLVAGEDMQNNWASSNLNAESYFWTANALNLLSTAELPGLGRQSSGPEPWFPTTGLDNGIYHNENAAALLARSSDTLFISFRGTNDDWDRGHWLSRLNHFTLFDPMVEELLDYIAVVADSDQPITKIVLTGHSLGGGMAQYALARFEVALSAAGIPVEAITFASPGTSGIPELEAADIVNFVNRFDPIRAPQYVSDVWGQTYVLNNIEGLLDNHSMGAYAAIAGALSEEGVTLADIQSKYYAVPGWVPDWFGVDARQLRISIPLSKQGDTFYAGAQADVVIAGLLDTGAAFADTLLQGVPVLGSLIGIHSKVKTLADSITSPSLVNFSSLFATTAEVFKGKIGAFGALFNLGKAVLDGMDAYHTSDLILGRNGPDYLNGMGGHDIIYGGRDNDTLIGQEGIDQLYGGYGDDFLDGRDLLGLRPNSNPDLLDGGEGDDTYVVDTRHDRVLEKAGHGRDRVIAEHVDWVLPGNVEDLDLVDNEMMFGHSTGTGNELANLIRGGMGPNALYGMDGNDTLIGDLSRDSIYGGVGDDVILVRAGDSSVGEIIDGGTGRDTIAVRGAVGLSSVGILSVEVLAFHDPGNGARSEVSLNSGQFTSTRLPAGLTLTGSAAADRLVVALDGTNFSAAGFVLDGWSASDRIEVRGNGNANTITGSTAADQINGGGGRDQLYGGNGNDTLDGQGANDKLWGQGGADVLRGGAGLSKDTLDGGAGDDKLYGQGGADDLKGGAGRDVLDGAAGNDKLWGQGGADVLGGGAGADTLDGGGGADRMRGGGGADDFVFRKGYGVDRITDFTFRQGDELLLDEDLWRGRLTVEQVIDQFATVSRGSVTLAFNASTKLVLDGVTDLGRLEDAILFV